MSRLTILAVLAVPTIAAADEQPHAVGAWFEMAVDSSLFVDNNGQFALDIPSQRLSIGAQLPALAIGLQAGFTHAPDSQLTRLELGPTARFTIASTSDHQTELLVDGTILVNVGLSSQNMGDGGPTAYIFRAGLEARHWIDRNLAIGGGVVGQVETISSGPMSSETDLGVAGTFRVTGVF